MSAAYKLTQIGEATGVTALSVAMGMGICLGYAQPLTALEKNSEPPNIAQSRINAFSTHMVKNSDLKSGENLFTHNVANLHLARTISHLKTLEDVHTERQEFLSSILEDFIGEDGVSLDDGDVSAVSLAHAIDFLLKLPPNYAMPTYDIHPDKEFSFVWSIKNGPILTLAFSNEGLISYAYFSPSEKERAKGQVRLDSISFAGQRRTHNALTLLLEKMPKKKILTSEGISQVAQKSS